jgi:hypothetical protein
MKLEKNLAQFRACSGPGAVFGPDGNGMADAAKLLPVWKRPGVSGNRSVYNNNPIIKE